MSLLTCCCCYFIIVVIAFTVAAVVVTGSDLEIILVSVLVIDTIFLYHSKINIFCSRYRQIQHRRHSFILQRCFNTDLYHRNGDSTARGVSTSICHVSRYNPQKSHRMHEERFPHQVAFHNSRCCLVSNPIESPALRHPSPVT